MSDAAGVVWPFSDIGIKGGGDLNNLSPARSFGYALLGVAPWIVWYAALSYYKSVVRSAKDPSAYTGTCYKPNGYAVSCTLEQWLVWDATPVLDFFIFGGAIAAAALSGLVFVKYLMSRVRNA